MADVPSGTFPSFHEQPVRRAYTAHSTTARLLSFRRRFGGSSLFQQTRFHSGTENLSNNSDTFRLEKPLTPLSILSQTHHNTVGLVKSVYDVHKFVEQTRFHSGTENLGNISDTFRLEKQLTPASILSHTHHSAGSTRSPLSKQCTKPRFVCLWLSSVQSQSSAKHTLGVLFHTCLTYHTHRRARTYSQTLVHTGLVVGRLSGPVRARALQFDVSRITPGGG
jgi:hypothetical protein